MASTLKYCANVLNVFEFSISRFVKSGEGMRSCSAIMENMTAAEAKFNDIISSPIRDIASKKIDNIAKKNQLDLDPSLLTMPTKAWSETKETTLVKDEVRHELVLYYTWYYT
jgi:hypothetical protein